MKDSVRASMDSEPMGIVISNGLQKEQLPVIRAFVWGPAPELTPAREDTKAA